MAFTESDFSKVWASTSPLTPYEFTEENYKIGWNFIGATPPSRQMWDFLQNKNDEKTQWLYNNKLSLSGGTMTGELTLADGGKPLSTVGGTVTGDITLENAKLEATDTTDNVNGYLQAYGWGTLLTVDSDDYTQAGAKITLNTKNSNSVNGGNNLGNFSIVADDGVNSTLLEGKPNGVLNWGGNRVQTAKQYSTTVTPASGFANYDSSSPLTAYRVGNVVQICAVLKSTTEKSDGEYTLFTLPNGYRPIDSVHEVKQGSSTARWLLKISTNGNATIQRYGTTSATSIPNGAWLPFSVTFITTNAYPS